MVINVKGINDYILLTVNDEVDEELLCYELDKLISSPSFKNSHYYPKAYFDFGKRIITKELFYKILTIFDKHQSLLFCGIERPKPKEGKLLHIKTTIRNGEIYEKGGDCLFEGKINPGGKLIVHGNLYILGCCMGDVELIGKDVSCCASKMNNARICINGCYENNLQFDTMHLLYENQGKIEKREEQNLWLEQL